MGTGKHSALKQSSDGSFELVVSDDVEEEVDAPAPIEPKEPVEKAERDPGGLLKWVVLAAVLLGVGVVGALVIGGSDDSGSADDDTPAGFKPYVGDDKNAESAIVPVDPVRPSKPARRAVSDEPIPDEEVDEVEEMEGTDDAWAVDENGEEIVESEEVPPDFIDQVVEVEGEGDEVEIEPSRDGTKLVNPRMLKDIRQRVQRDVEIRKTLPQIDMDSVPRIRPANISPGNAVGPSDPEDITVIEEEELEEIPDE